MKNFSVLFYVPFIKANYAKAFKSNCMTKIIASAKPIGSILIFGKRPVPGQFSPQQNIAANH
jgi:hypothetical protein